MRKMLFSSQAREDTISKLEAILSILGSLLYIPC
jgi:hypothetical protein